MEPLQVLFPSTTARSAANPSSPTTPLLLSRAREKRREADILSLLCRNSSSPADRSSVAADPRARDDAVAGDRELLLVLGGGGGATGHLRRAAPGAAGPEGRLGRAPRQVRGHQRVRLRLRPQRALVAAGAAPRRPAARLRAVHGPASRTTAAAAVAPEAEDDALLLLEMVVMRGVAVVCHDQMFCC